MLRASGVAKQTEAARLRSQMQQQLASEAAEDGRRATSPIGVMASSAWWQVVGALFVVSLLMGVLGLIRPTHTDGSHVHPSETIPVAEGGLAVSAVFAATVLLAKWAVRSSAQRELDWVAALPFPVHGHFQMLGMGRGGFKLVFADTAPSAQALEQLFAGVQATRLELRSSKNPFEVRYETLRRASPPERWRAWRLLVNDLLLPLHAKYPLDAVPFDD